MASAFDISSYEFTAGGVLYVAHGWAREVLIEATATDVDLVTSTLIKAGTPMCMVVGQVYWLPIWRDIHATEAYDSGTGLTTFTTDNSIAGLKVGDVAQVFTGVDGSPTTLGAVTSVTAPLTFTVATDKTGAGAPNDLIDITARATRDGAGLLLDPIEMFDQGAKASVNQTGRVLMHGVVIAGAIKGPSGSADVQLIADMPQISVIT